MIWLFTFQYQIYCKLRSSIFVHLKSNLRCGKFRFGLSKSFIWQKIVKKQLEWVVNVKSGKAMMSELARIYSWEQQRQEEEEEMWKSLSLLSPLPFVPLFPDMRTMAGLAFLLSCQRLRTKKFPLLLILHSINSLTTLLCLLSIKSLLRYLSNLKFNLFFIYKAEKFDCNHVQKNINLLRDFF